MASLKVEVSIKDIKLVQDFVALVIQYKEQLPKELIEKLEQFEKEL